MYKCEICGEPAKYRVEIADARKDYKFGNCLRCEAHAKRAVDSFGEANVILSSPEGEDERRS